MTDEQVRKAQEFLRQQAAEREHFTIEEIQDISSELSVEDLAAACQVLVRDGELFTHQIRVKGRLRTVFSRHRVLPSQGTEADV